MGPIDHILWYFWAALCWLVEQAYNLVTTYR